MKPPSISQVRYPRISIVTPSYNQVEFLEETLLSVKQQGYPDIEHLVFDGCSTDGSVELLQRISGQPGWEHLKWVSEPDRGQSDALNKGFHLASGDIVGWLNSDDRYRPGCFDKVVESFDKHSDADVIYGDYTWIDPEGCVLRIRREVRFSVFMLFYLHMLYVPTTSTFFRRRIFDEKNWIDIAFDYAMDYEFIVRLAQNGYRFRHVPALLADFRVHDRSKSVACQAKQRAEHDAIAMRYSPWVRDFRDKRIQRLILNTLRIAARTLRYSEKLLRGSYFEQYSPSFPGPFRWTNSNTKAPARN